MKRILSSVLLLAILVSVFSACSSGTEVTLLSFIPEEAFSMDFAGEVVTICSETDKDVALFEQQPNTTMYDAVLKRLDDIEQKYNCVIENVCFGAGMKMVNSILPMISTADPTIDIIYGHGDNAIGNLAVGDGLYPLTDLKDYIDYENSEKFGSAGILESAMVNGIPYAVQPVQWLGFANSFAYVLNWNVERFRQLGLVNLHEFYETKTWTWDNFESVMASYMPIAEPDKYFIAVYPAFFTLSAMMSNGVRFCNYDGEEFYCDIMSPNTLAAGNWAKDLFAEYGEIISFEDLDYGTSGFCNGRDLMVPAQAGITILSIPYSVDFEFGIMPFPSGPDGNYGEWANFVHAIRGFGISKFSDIPDISAMVINDLFEPFEEFGSGLADYYNEQVFFSETDTEIFLDIGKFARSLYCTNNMTMWTFAHEFKETGSSAAQIIDSYAERMEIFVAEELQPNYENYVHEHLYADK